MTAKAFYCSGLIESSCYGQIIEFIFHKYLFDCFSFENRVIIIFMVEWAHFYFVLTVQFSYNKNIIKWRIISL